MATDGKRSNGRFLYLFDWNSKSRKKLFTDKSESFESSSKGNESVGNSVIPHYLLQDSENGDHSSFRGNGNYNCASSVNGDDEYGTKAPGVVARLMGLDTLPTTSLCEASSFASYEPSAVGSSHYPRGSSPFELDLHNMSYGYASSKVEGFPWNPADPRMTKVHGRPLQRFQTEVFPPRSAKTISITHHKLLSPIKSSGFVPSKDAAYIMEAAARIIDPAPQPTGKIKIPSLGSPSSPFRFQDLKDKVDAAQRSYRLLESSKTPKRTGPVSHGRGSTSDRSNCKSLFKDIASSPASSSVKVKDKGKSIPLAVDKANVLKKDGSSYSDSSIQQQERKRLKQKESNTQKMDLSRSPRKKGAGMLKQNTERHNSSSHKDQSTSKRLVSDQQPRKISHGDSRAGPIKIVSKVFVDAENGSRKVVTTTSVVNQRPPPNGVSEKRLPPNGLSERRLPPNGLSERRPPPNGVSKRRPLPNGVSERRPPPNGFSERRTRPNGIGERRPPRNGVSEKRPSRNGVSERRPPRSGVSEKRSSLNRIDNISRSKQSSTKDYCLGEQVQEISNERAAERDLLLQGNLRKDMDVISFTFTSPIKKVGSQSASTSEAILSNHHHHLSADSCDSGLPSTSSSLPPLGLNGSLSLLLEQKIRELTDKIGSTESDLMMDLLDTSDLSCLPKSLVSHDVAAHSSISYDDWSDCDQGGVTWDDDCSSSIKSSHYWEDDDGVDEQSVSSNNRFQTSGESHLVDLNISNPEWSMSESWMSSTTSDVTHGYGQPSPQSQEVTSCVSSESVHPREEESEFINVSSYWELEYVRCMLHYAGLNIRLHKDCKTIDPGLFDLLENLINTSENRNAEPCSKLERKILFDGVSECVNAKYQRAFLGSYRSWARWGMLLRNDCLTEEVYKEILCWQNMQSLMVDDLVDSDMSTHCGRWLDFEVESLEEGMDIEKEIIDSLIDELLDDLTV